MSILPSSYIGEYLVPSESLLSYSPALFTPEMCIVHGVTSTYLPQFFRAMVQSQLDPTGFDNVDYRGQIGRLKSTNMAEDSLARLLGKSELFDRLHGKQAAHVNGLETFPVFAASILSAIVAGVDEERISRIGTLWLFLRQVYLALYVYQNKVTSGFRSLVWLWSLALCCNLLRESAKKRASKRILK